MFVPPSTRDVLDVAGSFGIHLSPEEASQLRVLLTDQLVGLDEFLSDRTLEGAPRDPRITRDLGYRPSKSEDPLNAWSWKCRIYGESSGVLAGLSVSFKDCIAVAGLPFSLGSRALEGCIANSDATIVARVLQAGGTVVGKNIMTTTAAAFESGAGIPDYGLPVNPQDGQSVVGGSSSGSAVAVRAGEVDLAFGADQAGSVRIPAAYCHIVGLKPTFGLIPFTGIVSGWDPTVDHVGPMAMSVENVARGLEAVAGFDSLDARQSRDVPAEVDVVGTLDRGIRGLRIGVLDEGFSKSTPPVILDAVSDALAVLSDLGATIERVSIPEHNQALAAANALDPEALRAIRHTSICGFGSRSFYPVEIVSAMNKMWELQGGLLESDAKLTLLLGEFSKRNFYGSVYAKAQNMRPAIQRAYDSALRKVDVLAMPTSCTLPPQVGSDGEVEESERTSKELSARGGPLLRTMNTKPFNFTGHPALALPCGSDGSAELVCN